MNHIRIAIPYGVVIAITLAGVSIAYADHNNPTSFTAPSTVMQASMEDEHEEDCVISRDLGVGVRGEDVECLQHALIDEKLLSVQAPTGYYGSLTKEAVEHWQERKGLPATGYFGALSRAAFTAGSAHEEEMRAETETMHMEAHPTIDVATWDEEPEISITVHKDSMAGWNLEIETENFTFAPEHVNGEVEENEGHAHIYVDGKKLARVYGNWFHIPKEAVVGVGSHEVLVTLNANDHSDLEHDGHRIEAKETITTQ